MKQRDKLAAEHTPTLPGHVKLHHDKPRDRWVLLAPERLLELDDVALQILRLCDGNTTVGVICLALAKEYNAPAEQIQSDVLEMLQELIDKDFLQI